MADLEVHCRFGLTATREGFTGSGVVGAEYRVRPDGCHAMMRRGDLETHEARCGFSPHHLSANEIVSLKHTIDTLQQDITSKRQKIETLESRVLAAPIIKYHTTRDNQQLWNEPRVDSGILTTVPAANTEVTDEGRPIIQDQNSHFRLVSISSNGGRISGYVSDNHITRVTSPSAPKVDAELKLLHDRSNDFKEKHGRLSSIYPEVNLSNARFDSIETFTKSVQHKLDSDNRWSPAERQHCANIFFNFYAAYDRRFEKGLLDVREMLNLACVIMNIPNWSDRLWSKIGVVFMELVRKCPSFNF